VSKNKYRAKNRLTSQILVDLVSVHVRRERADGELNAVLDDLGICKA
jgi:hypothetical protein